MRVRTQESVILAEKNAWYAFCSCVYGIFFVILRRILCKYICKQNNKI